MRNDEVVLTPEAIYNLDFKVDTRGYRPQDVDKTLDIIISDYKAYDRIIKSYENTIDELNSEILDLKHKLRNANESIKIVKNSDKEITNIDLLRRISQLEKIIYGKDEN